jgi:hypothetical protein
MLVPKKNRQAVYSALFKGASFAPLPTALVCLFHCLSGSFGMAAVFTPGRASESRAVHINVPYARRLSMSSWHWHLAKRPAAWHVQFLARALLVTPRFIVTTPHRLHPRRCPASISLRALHYSLPLM